MPADRSRRPLRPSRSLVAVAAMLLAACDASAKGGARAEMAEAAAPVAAPGDTAGGGDTATTPATSAGATAAAAGDGIAALASNTPPFPAVRALYVNRFAALSSRRMPYLIGLADSTEVNALVIDMKDEMGLNYTSANAAYNRVRGTLGGLRNVRAFTDTLKAHGILPIARIVVFKDSVAARLTPQWTIRRADGSIWRDHKGTAWVDPHNRELWEYNIGVAEELAGLGFAEIQFDYIRFPEPYKSLPQQVFPADTGQSKADAITEFLKVANERLDKLGVRTTADIFGLVTTVNGPLEVAQHWERLSPVTDVLLPMVYPSHYPRGSFRIPVPNADPYRTVNIAISRARERDAKLGIAKGENVRPYLQAFSLGKPEYGAEELRQQKQAVYDAGYDGWVLWHPGSKYEPFEAALERGPLVSRKKTAPTSAPGSVE